jgi:exodeoxyribonuclease VII large subunit
MPAVEVLLYPVRVQGAGAAAEIAGAIHEMNTRRDLDVLIVGRGGGSLEDLWAFNEEVVARAIAASRLPVISAVGHEVDVTIADYVADLRAPTPSAAAELVVRDRAEIVELLGNLWYTLRQRVVDTLRRDRERVASLAGSYSLNRPKDLLREYMQRLDEQERRMTSGLHRFLKTGHDQVASMTARVAALNPRSVLRRGYAIVRTDGSIRTRSAQLETGAEAEIEFHDGRRRARIEP